jgi:uncharacterized protein
MKFAEFIQRRAWPILLACLVIIPVILWGAGQSLRSNKNEVEDWLPGSFPETSQLRWFREHFSADRFVIISWEGCVIGDDPETGTGPEDDPRIEKLAQLLVPTDGRNAYSPYFQSVSTARRVLNELTNEPLNVPYTVAIERLRGALLGPDGRQSCVIATLSEEALVNIRRVLGRGVPDSANPQAKKPGLIFSALGEVGVTEKEARLSGPSIGNVAIDEEGERTLLRLVVISLAVGLGLAWWSLRSIRLTAIVFGCGITSAIFALAIVAFTGQNMDAVLLSMPSLVYVLAISGSVHLVNYYRDCVLEVGVKLAPGVAIGHGWKPALICSVTTALGLISLCTSDLAPIRKFGIYAASGVMGMLLVLFFVLPAALVAFPIRVTRRDGKRVLPEGTGGMASGGHSHGNHEIPPELSTWIDRIWGILGRYIVKHHIGVSIACAVVIGVMGFGLTRVRTNIDLLKLFNKNARILQDYEWLETKFGRLVPMEVVLRFPATMQEESSENENGNAHRKSKADQTAASSSKELSFLERMEAISLAQRIIERRFGPDGLNIVGKTIAAPTFAPELPEINGSTSNFVARSALNTRLKTSREAFERSGYFKIDPQDGSEMWRMSLRVAAFKGVDYGSFVDDIRNTIEPVVEAHHRREEILKQIIATQEGDNYAGAPVLFWYSPGHQSNTAKRGKAGGKIAPSKISAHPTKVDQLDVFAEALKELMVRERLKVVQSSADPHKLSLTDLDRLTKFRSIILAGNFSSADIALIRMAAPNVPISEPYQTATGTSPNTPGEKVAGTALASRDSQQELTAVYTGLVPIVYKAQRVLLNSLIESTIWSFATIAPLMMFVCRGILAGSVVMIPNVLPVLVIFGAMGWMGIEIDIGSMMSASIALGVAVDDTIHFLSWFREDMKQLQNRDQAILAAYRRCGTPTLQAALISGLGLSVFCFSTFTPTMRFGYLMLTILIAGVIAELIMLPAILAGPLGRVFKVPAADHDDQSPPKDTGWSQPQEKREVHSGEVPAATPHSVRTTRSEALRPLN